MAENCAGCVCSSADRTAATGRLLLATGVDHTATALRSLALRRGIRLEPLAPGLLSLQGTDLPQFLAEARRELSLVEADEVRAMVMERADLGDALLLRQAMSAPTLTAASARVEHAELLPLFDDEQRCFHSVYQPIVTLAQRRTIGYEALLRATTPDGAPVWPDVLFPAAEAAGWTHMLDRVGRTTALRGAGSWLGEDQLFINFIPTSIYRPEVCLRTTELAAREAGVQLDQLVFEVTEGHQVHDLDHLQRVFDYYRSRNCKVALDDLGAGYSSLNMLVRLQPDIVKLDKDVVAALPDRVSSAVVAAIVQITHAYGGLVLAECVETAEQAAAAADLGVDLGQGWFFGRPEARTDTRAAAVPAPRVSGTVDPSVPDAPVALNAADQQTGPSHELGAVATPELSGLAEHTVGTFEHTG